MSPDLVREWLDDATRLRPGPTSFAESVQRHRTLRVIREIKTGTYPIIDVSYSPDERYLTTVGANGYVLCWDLSTGENVWRRRLGIHEVPICRFHPGGDHILIIDNGQLKLLDPKTGDTIRKIDQTEHLAQTAAFSPTGNLVVVWNRSKMITVWDSQLDNVLRQFDLPTKTLSTIGLTDDELTVFAIAKNGNVLLGDMQSGELSVTPGNDRSQIHAAAFSPAAKHFAISRRHGGLRVFRSIDDEAPFQLPTGSERIDKLSFSRRGDWLLSGNRNRIEARNESTGWGKQWTRQIGAVTRAIQFSPSSDHYAIGLEDGRVQHCSLTAGRIDHILTSKLVRPRSLCIDPNRQLAIVAGASVNEVSLQSDHEMTEFKRTGYVCMDIAMSTTGDWYLATGKQRKVLNGRMGSDHYRQLMNFQRSVRAVALDESRQRLAVGLAGGEIKLVQLRDKTILESISTGHAHISALSFEPESGRLACGNEDGEIFFFDADCRSFSRSLAHDGPVTTVTFSRNGKRLASSSYDRRVRIIDLDDPDNELSIKLSRERVRAIAFSSDGETIAIGGADRHILLCDAKTGELQATLGGHRDTVTDLAFGADGHSLFSVSLDGTLRRWQPRP